jgi:hypothetical protein
MRAELMRAELMGAVPLTRNPRFDRSAWIPAFAKMTGWGCEQKP